MSCSDLSSTFTLPRPLDTQRTMPGRVNSLSSGVDALPTSGEQTPRTPGNMIGVKTVTFRGEKDLKSTDTSSCMENGVKSSHSPFESLSRWRNHTVQYTTFVHQSPVASASRSLAFAWEAFAYASPHVLMRSCFWGFDLRISFRAALRSDAMPESRQLL